MPDKDNEILMRTARRGQIKTQITKFQTYVSGLADSDNLTQLRLRKEKIEQCWEEFNLIQNGLEALTDSAEQRQYRDDFENAYFSVLAEAEDKLSVQKYANKQPGAEIENVSIPSQSTVSAPLIKMRPLEIPTFTGNFEEWSTFQDLFNSMVHMNSNIAEVQKFVYLRMYLAGEALGMVQNLATNAANYTVAWTMITTRYNNRRILIQSHTKAIYELEPIYKESGWRLRALTNNLNMHMQALKAHGHDPEGWGALLLHIILIKLDPSTMRKWESIATKDELPSIAHLVQFLQDRCQILEAVENTKNLSSRYNQQSRTSERNQIEKNVQNSKKINSFVVTNRMQCYMCKQPHPIYGCKEFLSLSTVERGKQVDKLKLCRNCLKSGHTNVGKCGSKRTCSKCNLTHNTLLHIDKTINAPVLNECEEMSIATHAAQGNTRDHVLLATAEINILNACGEPVLCRALLDSGSQSNFLTETIVQRLSKKKIKINKSIVGINGVINQASYQIKATVQSRVNTFSVNMDFLILPKITGMLPTKHINKSDWSVPSNISLADPTFSKPGKIDMLIGADTYWELMRVGNFRLYDGGPFLQNTALGWLISGSVPECDSDSDSVACCVAGDYDYMNIDERIEAFWKIEDCSDNVIDTTSEDEICRKHFNDNVTNDYRGKYIVKLPFKNNVGNLGESYTTALRRFLSLERRLMKNPQRYDQYKQFMNEYEQLKHMEVVPNEIDKPVKSYYLPHTYVINESSRTTKLRVVFDGSCKTDSGLSLNDVLYKGPVLQDDLILIVIRFRTHRYAFSADIKKMYRQVWVDSNDRNYQRILWRDKINEPIKTYRLCTVTYGTVPASFLSVACLQLTASSGDVPSDISQIILSDFCVDDCLTGASSIPQAINLRDGLIRHLNNNGFELDKWTSNNSNLLKNILNPNENSVYSLDMSDKVIKTLGLFWDAVTDCFVYKVHLPEHNNKITKRYILSNIARLFDPLGLLGPVIVVAKLLMQLLWKQKINWDDDLSIEIKNKWLNYINDLKKVNNISVPRWLQCDDETREVEIHGFSDASCVAYGACIYMTCTASDGDRTSRLVCAKSRVAPLKSLSIPRLELCAAVLLSKLIKKIVPSLRLKIDRIFLWTDSKVVLSWIASDASRWKIFIANRVGEIHNLTSNYSWGYVNTKENPADVLSKGCAVQVLKQNSLWWQGPGWLTTEVKEHSPVDNTDPDNITLSEERKVTTSLITTTQNTDNYFISVCEKYSSLTRFQRILAYVLRFKYNIDSIKLNRLQNTGLLTVKEKQNALVKFIKILQNKYFPNQQMNKKLSSLNPFIDSSGLIRVGGRLTNASDLSYDHRHPIIIPYDNHFSTLIFRHEHELLLHAGPQAMLANVRLTYWPINGRRTARKVAHACITCFKNKPKTLEPIMGNLPKLRVDQPMRSFENAGVDYAGPIMMKINSRRNSPLQKAYVCIFVCLATKAVHIELVCDLTTDAFIAALTRFISRRGKCKNMYSDNGTNFVGANRKLCKLAQLLTSTAHKERVSNAITLKDITWHFIPPRSPHFGGLWEAAVKAMKKHLNRTVANSHFTYDELYTTLTRIESCLNSRPLTPLSNDPSDLSVLTPAHFLIGSSLQALPESSCLDVPTTRLNRWQRVQQIVQQIWSRWSKEYLCQLQQRTKWVSSKGVSLKIGMLVLIKDNNLPPLHWQRGRVVDIHPGNDGVIRVATVQTIAGQVKRAVRLLCPLPTVENACEVSSI